MTSHIYSPIPPALLFVHVPSPRITRYVTVKGKRTPEANQLFTDFLNTLLNAGVVEFTCRALASFASLPNPVCNHGPNPNPNPDPKAERVLPSPASKSGTVLSLSLYPSLTAAISTHAASLKADDHELCHSLMTSHNTMNHVAPLKADANQTLCMLLGIIEYLAGEGEYARLVVARVAEHIPGGVKLLRQHLMYGVRFLSTESAFDHGFFRTRACWILLPHSCMLVCCWIA